MLRVVRASWTVIGRYGRPLHVNTSDRLRHLLIFATRLRDCRKTVKRFLFGRSDHGWKVGRHALRPKGACQLNDSVRVDVRRVNVPAHKAVDLEVYQSWFLAGEEIPTHRT